MQRLTYLLLMGVLTFGLIVSCTQNNGQTPSSLKQSKEGCRIIQHAMGESCVPSHPQRLITLNPTALGNAVALGLQPVGSTYDYHNRFPEYLEGKLKETEALGNWGQPSIEKIALLKPDLIVGWQHNDAAIYPQLSAIAPTILYDWRGNFRFQDYWKKYLDFTAEVLGRQEATQEVWRHYNERIKKLKQALGDRYKDKTISVVLFCCGGTIGSEVKNSFVGSILNDVGLQRPSSQLHNPKGFISFSEETLDMADGDVMFVMAHGDGDTGERDLNLIQQKPLWKRLKAVQQNRVYYVNPIVWRGRNPFAADAVIDDLYKYLVNAP